MGLALLPLKKFCIFLKKGVRFIKVKRKRFIFVLSLSFNKIQFMNLPLKPALLIFQSPSLILTGPGHAVRTMMCWTSRQERSPLKEKKKLLHRSEKTKTLSSDIK